MEEEISTANGELDLENNNTANYSIDRVDDPKRTVTLCTFLGISFFNLAVNFRVISVVVTMPRSRRKSGSYLIAHLSVLNIIEMFICGDYILNLYSHLSLANTIPYWCQFASYIRNTIWGMVPLNVAAITLEKTFTYRKNYQGGHLNLERLICGMWIIALGGNWPSIFTVKTTVNPVSQFEKCKTDDLFGIPGLTIKYEFGRLILYCALPILYTIRVLASLNSTAKKYLLSTQHIPNIRKKQEARTIRLAFINGTLFAILWLPSAALLFAYKVKSREKEDSGESTSEIKEDGSSSSILLAIIIVVFFYLIINPLIHLHLGEHLRDTKWYQFTYKRNVSSGEGQYSTQNTNEVNVVAKLQEKTSDNDQTGGAVELIELPVIKRTQLEVPMEPEAITMTTKETLV